MLHPKMQLQGHIETAVFFKIKLRNLYFYPLIEDLPKVLFHWIFGNVPFCIVNHYIHFIWLRLCWLDNVEN